MPWLNFYYELLIRTRKHRVLNFCLNLLQIEIQTKGGKKPWRGGLMMSSSHKPSEHFHLPKAANQSVNKPTWPGPKRGPVTDPESSAVLPGSVFGFHGVLGLRTHTLFTSWVMWLEWWGVVGSGVERQPGVSEFESEVRGRSHHAHSWVMDSTRATQYSQGPGEQQSSSCFPCQALPLAVGLCPRRGRGIFFWFEQGSHTLVKPCLEADSILWGG